MFDAVEFGKQLAIEFKAIVEPLKAELKEAQQEIKNLQHEIDVLLNQPSPKDGLDGKDGAPGLAGRDGLPGRDGKDGKDGQPGKDGLNGDPGPAGKDGADGLGIKDITFDGERRLVVKNDTHEFTIVLPIVIDRGIYRAETKYERGDGVSWDGSFWTAQTDSIGEKPGQGSKAWRLAVKRGRDGKDGQSIQGPPGPEGKPGRDLTQLGPDGSKW